MDGGRNSDSWYLVLHSDIRRVLVSKGVPPDVLDDVLAETAEAALRAQGRDSSATISAAWLNVVANRRLVDHWRNRKGQLARQDRVGFDRTLTRGSDAIELEDPTPTWLEQLPERQRRALVLRYCQGCSVSEVAEMIAVSYSGAESLLARGRANARNLAIA